MFLSNKVSWFSLIFWVNHTHKYFAFHQDKVPPHIFCLTKACTDLPVKKDHFS